jgi:hypothetical protein
MLNKRSLGIGTLLLSMLASWPAAAQEVATLALRNGERPAGQLLDLDASGFTIVINGQEQHFREADVASVEFDATPPPAAAVEKVKNGQGVILLKSGSIIDGRLIDIGGTHPKRLTFDTPSGTRDFPSNEIAQVLLHPLNASAQVAQSPAAEAAAAQAAAGLRTVTVNVPGNQPWTATNVTVKRGQQIRLNASGSINTSAAASSGPDGNRSATVASSRYPIGNAPVGALIARIGNGRPFLVGAPPDPISMTANGQLFLGVNDDNFGDNGGNYSVTIIR